MTISNVIVENFKGINSKKKINIKPITIFVGANSSGKSSCVHALACLSQTLKVSNNIRHLILDDEFASVHLGRFIDVVHSKSYQSLLSLGVCVEDVQYWSFQKDEKAKEFKDSALALYHFKCTKRTQDISLVNAEISIGEDFYNAKKSSSGYTITHNSGTKLGFQIEGAFLFNPNIILRRAKEKGELFLPLLQIQTAIKNELLNTLYLGPFRQAPMRNYPTRGSSPIEVGPMGESTITLLANEVVQTKTRPHIKQITKWLKTLNIATSLEVSRMGSSDLFDVSMKLSDGAIFPIADLGYGISQVLPVLAQCSFAPKNSTLLFEQPEIHLHSISAKKLAKVFFETANEKNCHIIIETHSPDLVKQFIQELKENTLTINDFVVYRVSRRKGESDLQEIEISGDYDVSENWERGLSIE